MLRVRNIDVYEAANGKAAAKMFDIGALKFAVIVSDLNMLEMNGLELLQRMRQKSQAPFIVFKRLTEASESQQAFALGASEFLTKHAFESASHAFSCSFAFCATACARAWLEQ